MDKHISCISFNFFKMSSRCPNVSPFIPLCAEIGKNYKNIQSNLIDDTEYPTSQYADDILLIRDGSEKSLGTCIN